MKVLAAAVLLSSSLGAEVHTVGPPGSGSDFASIQEAIDLAAAGDVVLVAPGDYAGFVLVKPILVLGAGSGATTVTAPYGWVTAVRALDVPAAQTAIVAGMAVRASELAWAGGATVEVQPMPGTLILHDVRTADGFPGDLDALGAGRLVLSRAAVLGHGTGSPAFRAELSRVWLVDSDLSKSEVPPLGWPATIATARFVGAEAVLAGCTVLGADIDESWILPGGNALELSASAALGDRLTLLGGDGATVGAGGFGARLTAGSAMLVGARSEVQGGLDGSGLVEQEPLSVEPGSAFAQGLAALPTLSATPARASAGDALELVLRGNPGDVGHLFASLAPGAGATIAGLAGDVFLDLGAPIQLGAFVLDDDGEARLTVTVPALGEPTLATFQWAAVAGTVAVSNPAFVGLE